VTRTATEIGAGLLPARAPAPIPVGERIHVVGIAGAGASAAALLARAAGAEVTGCDPGGPSPYTRALTEAGIQPDWQHDRSHIGSARRPLVDRLAVTKALTAVDPDHPELEAARAAGLAVEPWQQLIADAVETAGARLVAIAGTHGKSTSSGWLVHLLSEAGRDPSAFVGALLPTSITGTAPATARWGRGDVFVVEADEYAGNFDPYLPSVAVLLNLEWDHPDVFADEDAVLDAFEGWLLRTGAHQRTLVANVGDAGVTRLIARLDEWPGSLVRVSLDDGSPGHTAVEVSAHAAGTQLTLTGLPGGQITVKPGLPGRHNAANALCVAAAAGVLGLDRSAIAAGLESFGGVGRRLEIKGEPRGVLVIDDYGHHPTAIAATIASVRAQYPARRLWAVYEPLTFHRTAAMLDQFADVLAGADRVVVAEIWPGRDPDHTITSAAELAAAVSLRAGEPATAPGSPLETADHLAGRVAPGDVVLVMGGGQSYLIAERLVEELGG
jgi:UDP-N-acetylmuramate--alanine ligase